LEGVRDLYVNAERAGGYTEKKMARAALLGSCPDNESIDVLEKVLDLSFAPDVRQDAAYVTTSFTSGL
jgi:hypothetical protein